MTGFSIRDFGAKGDATALDTNGIQAAIDACAKAGGGTVLVPPGTYLTATVFLRDNVLLHLLGGAVLLGVADPSLYHECDFAEYPVEFAGSLIYAEGARNIGVSGPGVVDGQGKLFPYGMENYNAEEMARAETRTSFPRPVLLRFERCNNVALQDLTVQNAASMAVHFEGCINVRVSGCQIDNRANQNTDGINLIACEDVLISDTRLTCGDDAVAIYKSARRIVITNCVLSSRWAAFRIGPFSTGIFRSISVSNCVVHDTYGAAIKLQMVEGGVMEDIAFSNLVMENVTGPVSLRLAGWLGWRRERAKSLPIGVMRGISFSNIRATVADDAHPLPHEGPKNPGEARSCISITGLPGHPVTGVSFSNVRITFPGGGTESEAARTDVPELPDAYPEYHMFGVLPAYGMFARHVRDLVFHDVRFELAAPDKRPALVLNDAEDLDLERFKGQGEVRRT
jgi:polygalacturonase